MTPEQQQAIEKLPRLSRAVVMERIADPLASNEECYRRAGGKASNPNSVRACASEILTNPNIINILTLFNVESFDDSIASREEILQDLTDISRGTIYDVAEFRDTVDELVDTTTGDVFKGQSIINVKSMSEIKPEHRKLIKSVKQTKYGIEVQLHDAMRARQLLADMQGFNAPTENYVTVTKSLDDFYGDA